MGGVGKGLGVGKGDGPFGGAGSLPGVNPFGGTISVGGGAFMTLIVTHDWLFAGLVSFTLLTVAQFLIVLPAGAFTVALMVNVPEYPGGKVRPGPPQLASPVGMPRLHCQPGWFGTGGAIKVNPAGFGSCTAVPEIGPGRHAAVPTFVTVKVMVTCPPLCTGLGLTVFLMARSHFFFGVSTGTSRQARLFAGFVSLAFFTVAQFPTLAGGGAVTLKVTMSKLL